MAVASLDCRGQGGLSEDSGGIKGTTFKGGHIIRGIESPEKLLYRSIFLDTVRMTELLMDMDVIDNSKILSTGGSQGGALALAAALLVPEIAFTASAFPFLSDYKRVWDMDCSGAYQEIQLFMCLNLFINNLNYDLDIFIKYVNFAVILEILSFL